MLYLKKDIFLQFFRREKKLCSNMSYHMHSRSILIHSFSMSFKGNSFPDIRSFITYTMVRGQKSLRQQSLWKGLTGHHLSTFDALMAELNHSARLASLKVFAFRVNYLKTQDL